VSFDIKQENSSVSSFWIVARSWV